MALLENKNKELSRALAKHEESSRTLTEAKISMEHQARRMLANCTSTRCALLVLSIIAACVQRSLQNLARLPCS